MSQDELQKALRENADVRSLFKKYDKDGDGFIDQSERSEMRGVPQFRTQF